MSQSAESEAGRGPLGRLAALIGGVTVSLFALEFGYRSLAAVGLLTDAWSPRTPRLEAFREHIEAGVRGMFAPKAFVGYSLRGEGVNSLGFADAEWEMEAPEGVIRVACLGGSTTQDGVAPDRLGTYPVYLSRMLGRRFKRDVEVMNFGVNGWTSAESLINYSLVASHFDPDLVVIHHAVNDVWPRLYPDYQTDYTHYRVPWRDAELSGLDRSLISWSRLWAAWRMQDPELVGIRERVIRRDDGRPIKVHGELRVDTLYGYRSNLENLCDMVRADGATPLLMTMPFFGGAGGLEEEWLELLGEGTDQHNQVMLEVGGADGVLLADAASLFASDPEQYEKLFADYVHMKSEGNRAKALLIADAVQAAKLFR